MCPACGEQFACGATLRGCWCAEVKLSEAARATLRERYSGCLCRDCLQRYAAGATPGANP
ncbi:MAG: cysteine-rich CWC family protein [Candidatus Acidiferrales bacterium]